MAPPPRQAPGTAPHPAPAPGAAPHPAPAHTAQAHQTPAPQRSAWDEAQRLRKPVDLPNDLKHLQNDVKRTQAGLSLHDNRFKAYPHSAAMVAPDPHRYTVDLHGSSNDTRVGDTKLTPKDLADIIRSSGDWDGQPVRLVSCQTGRNSDGFAAQLAQELGVDVVAPTKDAWVDDMGNVFASSTHFDVTRGDFAPGWPPNGEWVTYKPDGTSTKHDVATPPGSTPTWGDNAPENAPRAWRRGDPVAWFTDWRGNRYPLPAPSTMAPHQTRQQQSPWAPPPQGLQPPRQRGFLDDGPRRPPAAEQHMRPPQDAGPHRPAPTPPPRRWDQGPLHQDQPVAVRPQLRTDVQWFRGDGQEHVLPGSQPKAVAPVAPTPEVSRSTEPGRAPAPVPAEKAQQAATPEPTPPAPRDPYQPPVQLGINDRLAGLSAPRDGVTQDAPQAEPAVRPDPEAVQPLTGMAARLAGIEVAEPQRMKWAQVAHDLHQDALSDGAPDFQDAHTAEARAHGTSAAPADAQLHFEDVSDQAVWRMSNDYLYRFDARHPAEIFAAGGFYYAEHKTGGDTGNQVSSNAGRMVSTTRDADWYRSMQFGARPEEGQVRWNYKIDAPGGIDILATLEREKNDGLLKSVDHEAEIAFLGGIDKKHIVEAVEVRWNGTEWVPTGQTMHNPYYEAPRTTS